MIALYFHIPYCLRKCRYCDFCSVTVDETANRYCDALARELSLRAEQYPMERTATVFFGGGTPTVLPSDALCRVLDQANRVFPFEKNAEIRNGMLIDYRDGKSYGVAKINGLYWMTDNLRYVDSVSMANLRGNSWCHEDDRTCSKFGRLYSWSAAMDADKKFNSNAFGNKNSSVQGICPTGWRLPTKSDIANLTIFVTMNNGGEGTGTSLKSTETWDKSDAARTPTNRFGFNAP